MLCENHLSTVFNEITTKMSSSKFYKSINVLTHGDKTEDFDNLYKL